MSQSGRCIACVPSPRLNSVREQDVQGVMPPLIVVWFSRKIHRSSKTIWLAGSMEKMGENSEGVQLRLAVEFASLVVFLGICWGGGGDFRHLKRPSKRKRPL